MKVEELLALARSKKADKKSVKAFTERVRVRSEKYEKQRQQYAIDDEFLSRSYNL